MGKKDERPNYCGTCGYYNGIMDCCDRRMITAVLQPERDCPKPSRYCEGCKGWEAEKSGVG